MTNNKLRFGFSEWRGTLYRIIFQTDTIAGRFFNAILMVCILLSVLLVVLESVSQLKPRFGDFFKKTEWFFTILFTIEYVFRLVSVKRPYKYALSFFGIIDFVAVIPMYLDLFSSDSGNVLIIRILRLLRIFRIFKLTEYLYEAEILNKALLTSLRRIAVFLFTVLVLIILSATLIYTIEGPKNGFIDIPTSIYWTIVTITTVGYGDIAPQTLAGKAMASIIMLLGYAIIAVPTGIITVELGRVSRKSLTLQVCSVCGRSNDPDAVYCKYCGTRIK